MSNNNNVGISLMNNYNINLEFVIDLLKKLNSKSSEERNIGEQILSMIKKDEKLYKILLEISVSQSELSTPNIKVQSLLILKSLIKQDNNNNNKVKGLDYNLKNNNNQLNDIYNFLKREFLIYLSLGNYIKSIHNPIKDIILLLSDKFFPDEWNELNKFFIEFFEKKTEIFFYKNSYDISIYLMSLFYSILKIFSKKKNINKFFKYKDNYLNSYISYYKGIIHFFNEIIYNFDNIEIFSKCLKFLLFNDKILCLLIGISYNQSTFQKDKNILLMIKFILERTGNIINEIEKVSNDEIKDILHHNLYKNLKLINFLQSTNPILFCYDLQLYIEILFFLISNCEKYKENTIKIVIFSLTKIMNTSTYKETFEIEKPLNENFIENISKISETPKKKRNGRIQRSPLNLFVSPTKYRNFEKEIKNSNELFNKCFTNENINNLLVKLIQKSSFIYKKENDDLEIEILSNLEEDNINNDNFSTNLYTFQFLFRNILESIIINFTETSMKYIQDNLNILYNTFTPNNSNIDFLLMDSFFNLINLIPELYKSGIIYITEMIDTKKYISYIYSFIQKSNLILKKYIITLSKWSVILISNEIIFDYINNLINFIENYNNNYILIESCLCLKTILDSIDKMMSSNENINTTINRELYSNLIKTKINWSNLLCLVSNLLCNIIPKIKSSELIVSLVKFFTSLIKKCHYQNNGEILNTIKNSKLIEITSNNKNEFTENVYIDMFKTLLTTFPSSYEITEMSFFFVENCLKRKINSNSLNFLLYIVKSIESTEENKKLVLKFIQNHYKIFIHDFSQEYNNILLSVLEEIILFNILEQNDLINIIDIINTRYNYSFEICKQIYQTIINNNVNINKEFNSNLNSKGDEMCDSKKILLDVLNSIFLVSKLNYNDNNISYYLENILKILFTECKFSYETLEINSSWLNSDFINSMFEIIDRIALNNFDNFIIYLNHFLKGNNLQPEFYISNMLKVMTTISKIEVRKINVLFISKIISLFDYNFLLKNAKIIFEISLQIILNHFIKNNSKNNDSTMNSINHYENLKEIFQIKQSTIIIISKRKKDFIENEPFLKLYDIHKIFIESIKGICNKFNKSEIDFLKESNFIANKNIKTIFGLVQY